MSPAYGPRVQTRRQKITLILEALMIIALPLAASIAISYLVATP